MFEKLDWLALIKNGRSAMARLFCPTEKKKEMGEAVHVCNAEPCDVGRWEDEFIDLGGES